jgi:hypothetical protein
MNNLPILLVLASLSIGLVSVTIYTVRKKLKIDTDLDIIEGRLVRLLYDMEHGGGK